MSTREIPSNHERTSCWSYPHKARIGFPELGIRAHLETEVCVVGCGITGLSTAYELLKCGKSVVLVDASDHGENESQRTTGHLTYVLDERYGHLVKAHGTGTARLILGSHQAALTEIRKRVKEHQIDCDFTEVDGFLLESKDFLEEDLIREGETLRNLGSHSEVELLEESPMQGFSKLACLRIPGQARFDPAKYLNGLKESVLALGGRIYTGTQISEVQGGKTVRLFTSKNRKIDAKQVVLAGDAPVADLFSLVHKLAPYRTYVISGKIPRAAIQDGLYWDTEIPYHYIRFVEHSSSKGKMDPYVTLIAGGEDHRTGQANPVTDYFQCLEDWVRTRFPSFQKVQHRWSGQILIPADGIAYIGKQKSYGENVFVATGFSGNGLTYGTIAGLLLRDLILGRPNAWEKIYAPSRMKVAAIANELKENWKSAIQYRDWVTPGDAPNEGSISVGSGMIIRDGARKIAVYRDPGDGQVHYMNATCPHMGGVVRWNPIEHTWDCPCHGSRFDCKGKLRHGPAAKDLERVDGIGTDPALQTIH